MIWLELAGPPRIAIVQSPFEASALPAIRFVGLASVGSIRRQLVETANIQITLSRAAGIIELFRARRILTGARVMDDNAELLAGTIQSIGIGPAEISLTVAA